MTNYLFSAGNMTFQKDNFSSRKLKNSILLFGLSFGLIHLSGCSNVSKPDDAGDHYAHSITPTTSQKSTETTDNNSKILNLSQNSELRQAIEDQYQKQVHLSTPITSDNVWDNFHRQLTLVDSNLGHFDGALKYYQRKKHHLYSVSERAEPYLYYIIEEVKKRDMPLEIALLPMIESGFKPRAKSHQKALGLWQFMPATGKMLGLDRNWWYEGRQDVILSTQAALTYLQRHYNKTNDWLLSLAAYNAGYGNVLKAVKRYRRKHGNDGSLPTFWQIKRYLPKETQNYVPSLLSVAYLIEHSDANSIALKPIKNRPFFNVVELKDQVSLYAVANTTQTSKSLLEILNPGYVRRATPPDGPHHILLPVEKQPLFTNAYQQNADLFRVNWQRHKVRSGDYLGKIANRYHTSISSIKKLNRMKSNFLRVGETILIPVVDGDTNLVAKTQPALALRKSKSSHIAQADKYEYTVKSGDTLSGIAAKFSVSTQKLKAWNQLSQNSYIRVGQKLQLAKSEIQRHKITHKVKSGENLGFIALQHGVDVRQLVEWNGISIKKPLRPGELLTVWQGPKASKHAKYTVKNGDNLWVIAKEFKLSVNKLATYNQISLKTMLQPGQVIKIPFSI